jgi:hypothetical protein
MRSEGKSFVAEVVGGVGLMVQGKDPIPDDEWDRILEFYRQLVSMSSTRCLVYTDGSAPTATQRGKLQTMLGKTKITFAVLTPSAWARAVGAAISWFVPSVGMFKPTELDKAFDHLQAKPEEREGLRATLERLRRTFEGTPQKQVGS